MRHRREVRSRPPVCLIVSAFLAAARRGWLRRGRLGPRADPPVPVAVARSVPETGPHDRAANRAANGRNRAANGPAQNAGGSPATAKVVKTGPFEKTFDGIRFSVPAGWNEVENPTPEFVDARFQIPTPHGVVKLTFSSNSGGADVNIKRWIGQFQLAPGKRPIIEDLNVDKAPPNGSISAASSLGARWRAAPRRRARLNACSASPFRWARATFTSS